jgi:hypothetical protein
LVKMFLIPIGYLVIGTLFVLAISGLSPKKLVNENGFRQDVAFWMLLVWPVPLLLLCIRGLIWPSTLLAKRVERVKPVIE